MKDLLRLIGGSRSKSADRAQTMGGAPARVDVLGVGISAIDMRDALAEIGRFIREGQKEYVCVTGVHGVMECQRDSQLLEIHNRSGLTTPDGMPMVWAGKWAGVKNIRRVYGPELMLEVCRAGLNEGWSHFFYGGNGGVAGDLAGRLGDQFHGLVVAGTHTPPFRNLTPAEADSVAKQIDDSRPNIVWVGLSTPKQERWMAMMRPKLEAQVLIGVGAAFDIHAGRLEQAPQWMRKGGLEWVFRLWKEPRRLWRRYLRNNPAFMWRVLRRPPRLIPSK